MCCSARAPSAAALAGAAPGAVAPPAFADITPRSVAPGGAVTVSGYCDAAGAGLPDSVEGVSQAFEGGKIRLNHAGAFGTAVHRVWRCEGNGTV
jgi:hypothetical protein